MKPALIIGSTCVDVIINLDHLPKTDENLRPYSQSMALGGCAYNVSHMMRLLKAPHTFITPVGTGTYGDYVEKELPEAVHSFFHLSEKREETFIAGASMGATGALTIGLSKPENYAAIGVFSAGNWVAEKMYTEDIMPAETIAKRRHTNFLVYGMEDTSPLIGNPEYDAFAMAQKALDEGKPLPKIFHATGTEDHKYENTQITRRFFESLPGNPFRYEYHECPGTHCWKVFDHWIQKFLDQIEIKE